MPSLSNRAMLLELTVYLAENNIRRSVMTAAINVQTTDQEVLERSKTIAALASWTFESLSANRATVIRAIGGPIRAVITKGTETWTTVVNSLFVITDEIGNIKFENQSTERDVQVRVMQV